MLWITNLPKSVGGGRIEVINLFYLKNMSGAAPDAKGLSPKDMRMMGVEVKDGGKPVKFVIRDRGSEAGEYRFQVVDETGDQDGFLATDAAKVGIELSEICAGTEEEAHRLAGILNKLETQIRIHELAARMRGFQDAMEKLGEEEETPVDWIKQMDGLEEEAKSLIK